MANEGQSPYLSNQETVEKIYGYLQSGQIDSSKAYLIGLGDDKVVIQTWMNVQCDINNVKKDPKASAEIGQVGVDYSLEKGFKLPAAMMLHNISAFFMPDFDEGVDPENLPLIISAATQQLTLRREIPQPGPLMWSLWDLGIAELAAGNASDAIKTLEEGIKVADEQDDKDGAAWCRIFIGKAKVKYLPELIDEGKNDMQEAAMSFRKLVRIGKRKNLLRY